MKSFFTLLSIFSFLFLISFTAKSSKKEKLIKEYVYIPSGTFDYNSKKTSVNSFYMSKGEVTNKQYRTFLNDLKSEGKNNDFNQALPDTSAWVKTFSHQYYKPMANFYFWHPSYDNYPVVNISKKGAELYCIWLTKLMRTKYPKQNFNDFRLPTKTEWVYAAKGGNNEAIYPWGHSSLRNSKGDLLACFTRIGERNITKDSLGNFKVVDSEKMIKKNFSINDYYLMTQVESYNPNPFGLYNMAGNVAELVANDNVAMGGSWYSAGYDVQVTSEKNFSKPNPTTGFRVVSTFTLQK